MHNKYTNYSTERLLQEYNYMTPSGKPQDTQTIEIMQDFGKNDMMHFLMVVEAMAERLEEQE